MHYLLTHSPFTLSPECYFVLNSFMLSLSMLNILVPSQKVYISMNILFYLKILKYWVRDGMFVINLKTEARRVKARRVNTHCKSISADRRQWETAA